MFPAIIVFVIFGGLSAFLGAYCSPVCDFRDSDDSPVGVSMVDAAKVYSYFSESKGRELIENCQACNDNKSLYKDLEDQYEKQRPINIMVFQILLPVFAYLSFGVKSTDYFYHFSFILGYALSLFACRRLFHIQTYKESPKHRLSAPYPETTDPEYFFKYWNEESLRSYDITSSRRRSMQEMFDAASSFQKIVCFYGGIPIIMLFLNIG